MDKSVASIAKSGGEASEPLFYKRDVILSKVLVDVLKTANGKELYTIVAGTGMNI